MPVSMDGFRTIGQFATYDPFAKADRSVAVFQIQCRSCGYEPADAVSPPSVCPKCNGTSFERFARPGSILENAERYSVPRDLR